MTESEIDEMIKHLEKEKFLLSSYLKSYKEIFVYLNNIFSPLLEKNRSYDSYESKLDQLIDKNVLDKLDSLYKEFNQQNNIIIDYKHKLLHAKRDEITVFESNKIQQTLTEVTQKLREIHTKVLEIEGINGLLANILAENLSKTTTLSKELEDKIELSEKNVNQTLKTLEEKIVVAEKVTLNRKLEDRVASLNDEARKFRNGGNWWLSAIVLTSILIFAVAVINVTGLNFGLGNWNVDKVDLKYLKPDVENNNVFWIYLFSRVSVAIVPVYFLFFAIKNYRSIKHTEFVYRQKASVLDVYTTLLSITEVKDPQGELVRQIGRSVFEIHQTGYIKENQDKDSVENMNIVGEAASRLLKKE